VPPAAVSAPSEAARVGAVAVIRIAMPASAGVRSLVRRVHPQHDAIVLLQVVRPPRNWA
jgi:hypothetical protein